jgi:hypothetical protein
MLQIEPGDHRAGAVVVLLIMIGAAATASKTITPVRDGMVAE